MNQVFIFRYYTIQLLEENIGETSQDIGKGKHLLENISKAQAIKAGLEKWDCTKLRRFCTAKEYSTN